MTVMYEGIPREMLILLAENRFQDSKAYYEEHKAAIKAGVIEPLRRLTADLAPTMLAIDPLLMVDPMTNGCVSRVRRDTRYTNDKSLYRENMWIAFMRDKRAWNWCVPAFYLDFSIGRAEWGLGFYSARPDILRALRRRVDADPSRAVAAVRQAERAGFSLAGEPYAKPRHTEEIPEILWPLYDCRNVDLTRHESPDFVADTGLPERLAAGYTALAPIYRLLTEAVEEAVGLREE